MTTSKYPRRHRFSEYLEFVAEAILDPRATGAIAPSGRALARLLTEPVRAEQDRPLRILEVGAGTGAVTRALLPLLRADSELDIVEANPRFAELLRELADAAGPRVRLHRTLVEELETSRRYDVIVSGLPFTNFEPHQVDSIMGRYFELLRPGGVLTYFAYRGTATARGLLSSRSEALRHRRVEAVLDGYRRRYALGCRTAWLNLPPARVHRLCRPVHADIPVGTTTRTER
ncbi:MULTISPECIES: methyltransferase domain-containing protein [unclassified Nocardia]|uniref:class I SAM-dependent methyltransferase n=1 Tax=unclassified Nocardia TaxID=2637762 RepID=UPI001CE47213|nr:MULTISPECIES: methyltransferase domain-containing protein [unclassified Nocardia]